MEWKHTQTAEQRQIESGAAWSWITAHKHIRFMSNRSNEAANTRENEKDREWRKTVDDDQNEQRRFRAAYKMEIGGANEGKTREKKQQKKKKKEK